MLAHWLNGLKRAVARCFISASRQFITWTQPTKNSVVGGVISDMARSKAELMMENAFLRQQLIVLRRQVKRPLLKGRDRLMLVLLASKLRHWKEALLIIKPETLLAWHRQGFRLLWKWKSIPKTMTARVPAETVALVKQMALENRLWGAERIRGELLKLNIKLAKRTIQKYLRQVRPQRPSNQTWTTFVRNHAAQIWACDFLPVIDIAFRQLYAFFIIDIGTRQVVHLGVTAHPTDQWVAQQLREATPFDQHPTYLIRDNDAKYGTHFKAVVEGAGIQLLRTPIAAPKANAFCERFLGSVRRECLDHVLIFSERQLARLLKEYVHYFNHYRPHQGLYQQRPVPPPTKGVAQAAGEVKSMAILNGLHHHYHRAA